LAGAGFDWIVVDCEHAPNDVGQVLAQLQAMRGGTAEAVARPPWNDFVQIKRLLDIGARSLIVPFIQSAEEARFAVAATRYPPRGIRGTVSMSRASAYGRIADYVQHANDEICLIVQIETGKGLDQIDAILAVAGVDAVFFGPADIASDMGLAGNGAAPEVQAAMLAGLERCRAAGKPAGTITATEAHAERLLSSGFTFVAVGSDVSLLTRHADALVRRLKPR
jgi:4-hydroxy-2-oxoheptanedioate aldolase